VYQGAQVVGIGLSERQLRREQVAISLNHIEVGGIAGLVTPQGDRARPPQRVDLARLLALLLPEFLVSNEGIRHVLECPLHRLLVLVKRFALARVGNLNLVQI
jgi:hypothetical protein